MTSKSLKIAINTRALMKGKLDGIGWFTFQVVKRWVEQHPQHQFYFLFDRDYDHSFIFGKNVTPIVVNPPARHPILWYIWYEFSIPIAINKINPDVFVSLDTYTSIRWQGKKITGIHDIAFALFDGHVDKISQWFLRKFTPQYIDKSDRIVTVSESTKADLINFYHCPVSKIVVSHNAPSSFYKTLSEVEKNQFKAENTNSKNYFLFVGTIQPRKNVIGILKSFEYYKETYQTDEKLVLIGKFSWKCKTEEEYIKSMKYQSDLILLPHSSPEYISKWMASSIALLMTSIYEGFGVPIVEAMASGTAVICSNRSSMPEVAGGAALLVEPTNTIEISNAMYLLSTDKGRRADLIEKGMHQVKKYNWDSAASIIWMELENLIYA